MRKIAIIAVFCFVFGSGLSFSENVNIKIGENSQKVFFRLEKGKVFGVATKSGKIKLKNIIAILFNSDKVGWQEYSEVGGELFKKTKNRAVFRIYDSPNNDWGNWCFVTSQFRFIWVNVDEIKISGMPWEKKGNMIRYGNYQSPQITFSSPGNVKIKFNSNFLSGFNDDIDPDKVVGIYWNSDKVGWGENSQVGGSLEKDYLGNFECDLSGIPNTDKGNFTAKLDDGTLVWMNPDKWKFSSNVLVVGEEGQIEYVLAPEEEYRKPRITFSSENARIEFNSNFICGFNDYVDSEEIKEISWNSDNFGWDGSSQITGTISVDSFGNYLCEVSGIPNADNGNFVARKKDGTLVWLDPKKWELGSNTSIDGETGLIKYAISGEYQNPQITFSSPGNVKIKFNSNFLSGFNDDIDPDKVVGIYWNSDKVGWGENSQVGGSLEKDYLGNFECDLSGIPNTDKGNFTAKLDDGTLVWMNPSKWECSENVVVDEDAGQIEYVLAP